MYPAFVDHGVWAEAVMCEAPLSSHRGTIPQHMPIFQAPFSRPPGLRHWWPCDCQKLSWRSLRIGRGARGWRRRCHAPAPHAAAQPNTDRSASVRCSPPVPTPGPGRADTTAPRSPRRFSASINRPQHCTSYGRRRCRTGPSPRPLRGWKLGLPPSIVGVFKARPIRHRHPASTDTATGPFRARAGQTLAHFGTASSMASSRRFS